MLSNPLYPWIEHWFYIFDDFLQTWETQASHFKDFDQWTTIDRDNYKVAVNGRWLTWLLIILINLRYLQLSFSEEVDGKVAYEIGNYNALMKDCPAYQKCKLSYFFLSSEISFVKLSSRRSAELWGVPWVVPRGLHRWFPLGSFESSLRSSHSSLHLETLGCP